MRNKFVINALGINDMDAYGVMWYGNYIKWYLNALNKWLGFDKEFALLRIKYKHPVKWGDKVSIVSIVVSKNEILQIMKKDSDEMVMNWALFSCNLSETGFILDKSETMLYRQLKVKSSYQGLVSTYSSNYTVWKNNIMLDGKIDYHYLLDLFEQNRTEAIGGQDVLQRIHQENDQSILVANLGDLKIGNTVSEGQVLRVVTKVTSHYNWMIFKFVQECWYQDKSIGSMNCELCIYNSKLSKLEPVVDYVKSNIMSNN